MEKEHRYKDGNRRWRLVMLWETVLEEDEAGSWPVHKLGITASYPDGYAEMIDNRALWRRLCGSYGAIGGRGEVVPLSAPKIAHRGANGLALPL